MLSPKSKPQCTEESNRVFQHLARYWGFVFVLGVVGLLMSCSSATRDVRVALVSTRSLNAMEAGSGLPVMVRIYQLRDRDKFENASFRSLWKQDREFLGDDLVSRKDLILHPESETLVDLAVEVKKGVEYVGIMALFRNPEGNSWRKVLSSDLSGIPFMTPEVRVMLDNNTVTLEPD